jgi:hypothetical protein
MMTITPTETLTSGDRIVWGPGKLPGVYNGPATMPGWVSIKLDIDRCSTTVLADGVSPVEVVDEDICPDCKGHLPATWDFCEWCEFGPMPS